MYGSVPTSEAFSYLVAVSVTGAAGSPHDSWGLERLLLLAESMHRGPWSISASSQQREKTKQARAASQQFREAAG
ncbi:hypothetical protein I7I51_00182 [Histoplasma capsulatum]|uniref:Uncharacterized protein n=1 Tax=Ajellomyces capsulatus TaxID=5037 RepID=A0A8A1MBC2_AJECA|nr:predicted protein [Histoplasma mississippiense (nom. inval.)]EDN08554.1 predicted protein [Histoplasma mississippiense (nom. inval.)]QSS63125.1 hypothetical protein I7I51_00182 [Histoplasma capsulatum]